ncbi:Inactive beta-amylase 9-like protein [Drosera capensis]
MELLVMAGSRAVVKVGGLKICSGFGVCGLRASEVPWRRRRVSVGRKSPAVRLRVKAKAKMTAEEPAEATKALWDLSDAATGLRPVGRLRLRVGLPLDTVSECHTVNHAKAITAGLKALKLMGVDGVELPVWWGLVERDSLGKYEWSGYLAVAEMVQKVGLKLHISLCFHACREIKLALPDWVCRISEDHPGLFFTDRSGNQFNSCLSFGVDDLPVLDGKTPIQVYQGFCKSFKSTFAPFMGSTITDITVGLGPDGELRYPSSHLASKINNDPPGVGEFQCYDQHILNHLKQHAEEMGNPLWGNSGPHDAPSYNNPPMVNSFFKDEGGSWDSPYGDFFLSWYSSQLISHVDRILSLASTTFRDTRVSISGRVPIIHSWCKTRSHPSELTAGFYNTVNRDGYEPVAAMFAKHACEMILPGMDLLDEHMPRHSSPQSLLEQIKAACKKHGIIICGENASASVLPGGFQEIRRNLLSDESRVNTFMYQRMGASFFSPEHFPLFSEFVRGFSRLELHPDDVLEEDSLPVSSEAGIDLLYRWYELNRMEIG